MPRLAFVNVPSVNEQKDNHNADAVTNHIEAIFSSPEVSSPASDYHVVREKKAMLSSDALWQDMYNELVNFREREGHCQVPAKFSENPKLGNWVRTQRAQRKKLLNGEFTIMTAKRVQALEAIGFVWEVRVDNFLTRDKWMVMYEELQKYRKETGRCCVTNAENSKLAYWITKQRKQYQSMKNGKPSTMTEDRVELLNQLEFVWKGPPRGNKPDDLLWMKYYEELRRFHAKNGHGVPRKYYANQKLVHWVYQQRKHYKQLIEGKPTNMTQERIEALEKLDFSWDAKLSHTENAWKKNFEKLCLFKLKYGHSRVPVRYEADPKLGTWVTRQRKRYKLLREGKKSDMTMEQFHDLETVGFEWVLEGRKRLENCPVPHQ